MSVSSESRDEPGAKGGPSEAVPSPPGCGPAASEHGRGLPAKRGPLAAAGGARGSAASSHEQSQMG